MILRSSGEKSRHGKSHDLQQVKDKVIISLFPLSKNVDVRILLVWVYIMFPNLTYGQPIERNLLTMEAPPVVGKVPRANDIYYVKLLKQRKILPTLKLKDHFFESTTRTGR